MYSHDFMVLWHGMKEPVWFPYRNSFVFSFFVCVLAARAIQKFDLSIRTVIGTSLITAMVIVQAFLIRNIWFTLTLLCIGLIFIGIQWLLIIFYGNHKYRRVSAVLLTVICIVEITSNFIFNIKKFENYSAAYLSDYYNTTQQIIAEISHDGVYKNRMEKTFYRTYNDPMMFSYPGITHFGSTEDVETTELLYVLGFNSETYTGTTTAFSDSFLSIANLVSKDTESLPEHFEVAYMGANGVTAKNPYAFPMVFEVSNGDYVLTVERNNIFKTQNNLFNLLGGEGELFTDCTADARLDNNSNVYIDYEDNNIYYLSVSESEKEQKCTSCISSYKNIDGVAVFNTISFENTDNISVWKMDKKKLSDLSMKLNEKSGDTKFTSGSFSSFITTDDSLVIINVPHSKFIKVTVDNKTADTFKVLGGLTAVKVDKGMHEIQVGGKVPGAVTGLTISLLSVLIFIWFIYNKKNSLQ